MILNYVMHALVYSSLSLGGWLAVVVGENYQDRIFHVRCIWGFVEANYD